MSDNTNGVPITYVTEPPVAAGTAIVAGGTIAATGLGGGPIQAFIVGGTVSAEFNFVGTVRTDIGQVKIEGAEGNLATVRDAGEPKDSTFHCLVVQSIDEDGTPLSEATQVAIRALGSNANKYLADIDLNTMASAAYLAEIVQEQGTQSTALLTTIVNQQGTQATSANQLDELVHLSAILDHQGTQATSALQVAGGIVLDRMAGTIATSALQAAAGVLAVAMLNNQGTMATSAQQADTNAKLAAVLSAQGSQSTAGLATSANQTTGNAIITVIMNSQGTQSTQTLAQDTTVAAILNSQGTQATAANQTTIIASLGDSNAKLASILTAQGSQSTAGLATSANQTTGNAVLTLVMNNEGTLATSAAQTTTNNALADSNAKLAAILSAQGSQSTAGLSTTALQTAGNTIATVIMNNEGTLATAANQTSTVANQQVLINQLASIISVVGPAGTDARNHIHAEIALNPYAPCTDAFGRLRVSTPDYQFDAQLCYSINSDQWDQAFKTGGTITYNRTDRNALLTTTANGTAVMQGHYAAHYTPGRGQLALMTFTFGTTPADKVYRRVGYYDGTDGIYLEHASDGLRFVLASSTSNGNQSIPQGLWNVDKFDGTGPSALTLDPSKSQILVISIQALYTGRVIVGFDIDGVIYAAHIFTHANKINVPYIANASQPIRYEVGSTGSNVGTMKAICASVMSESGGAIIDIPARPFTASNGGTTISVNTRRPVLSIRSKNIFNQIKNNGIMLPTSLCTQGGGTSLYVELVRNGVLTGASFADVDSNSFAEFDVAASAISGGQVVWSGYSTSGSGLTSPLSPSLMSRLVIAYSSLLGSSDTLSVVCTSLGGASATTAALNWKEIR